MSQPMPAPKSVNRLREMLPSHETVLPFLMRLFLVAPIVFLGGLDCLLIPRLKGLFASLHPDVSGLQSFVLSFGLGFQTAGLLAISSAIWILFKGKGSKAYTVLSSLVLFLMIETALLAYSTLHLRVGLSPAIRM